MSLEILNAGVQSLLQDAGRFGLARYGVPRSGPFDRGAWQLANGLVGNYSPADFESNPGPVAIEVLFGGLRVQAHRELTVAVTGGHVPLTVLDVDADDKREVATNEVFILTAGSRLHIGTARVGLRSYLAVSGGFDVEYTLGSGSTDTSSGLGPPPLTKGQRLATGPAHGRPATNNPRPPDEPPNMPLAINVRVGPHLDLLDGAIEALTTRTTWTVSPTSGRSGIRLTPTNLQARARTTAAGLPSEPTLCGAIQALPNGELVVLGPDGPTTGGYPVVAVVDQPGINRLAQARPGAEVQLTCTIG